MEAVHALPPTAGLEPRGRDIVIWRRRPDPRLTDYLAAIASAARLRVSVAIDRIALAEPCITAALADAGLAANPQRTLWAEELAALCALLHARHPNTGLRLRLEAVAQPDCRLFHVDRVVSRLLCTYHGPGTQWLDEDNAVRGELGLQGRTIERTNAAIVRDPGRIHTLAPWWVAICRGCACPGNERGGLVHRAYPDAVPRLRLRLDTESHCPEVHPS